MLLEMICKKLGVEIGEEWVGNDGKFYSIEKNGKLINYFYKEEGRKSYTDWIERVLSGELKPVWRPRKGERYYIPNPTSHIEVNRFEIYYCDKNNYDDWALRNRMVYKTREEAIGVANKMLEAIKEDKNDSI